ncbi:hypothetical protein IOLA_024 [uncultured bacterium]|uniref:Uncharacterized protein n=1 Tax=uncultured microorganism TaxID=358574 RepID=A0A077JGF5_9ZZZZ|nr:hypothetical protein [uncultured microorganism]BCL65656.1 hypothetical protein IOLA_024 [uncultured bacterium]
MNLENLLDKIGIIISTISAFIFFVKLLYIIISDKIKFYEFNFYKNFLLAINPKNIKIFIFNTPILFYTITICSTSVLLAFTPMILRCREIHILTFYISIFIFFSFAAMVRYITLNLISNNKINNHCISQNIKQKNISDTLKYYLYLLAISPVIFDATCFRRSALIIFSILPSLQSLYLSDIVLYSSVYILIIMLIVLLLKHRIQYISRMIMIMFMIIVIASVLNFDIKSLTGLFLIPNNKFTIYGFCMAMFYANLLSIYVCDLFCICIEYIYIRYVESELIKKNIIPYEKKYAFYMFSSILISILALLWVLIFINIGTTNMLQNSKSIPMIIIQKSLNTVFIIQSMTNIYFLYDFFKLNKNKFVYISIPLIFVFNYFWFPNISVISVIVYLLGQLISCIELVRKL